MPATVAVHSWNSSDTSMSVADKTAPLTNSFLHASSLPLEVFVSTAVSLVSPEIAPVAPTSSAADAAELSPANARHTATITPINFAIRI